MCFAAYRLHENMHVCLCPIRAPFVPQKVTKGYIRFSLSFSYTKAFGLQVMAYLQYRIINMRFPNNHIHILRRGESKKMKIEGRAGYRADGIQCLDAGGSPFGRPAREGFHLYCVFGLDFLFINSYCSISRLFIVNGFGFSCSCYGCWYRLHS